MKFKVGDKVKITSTSKYYSEDTPHNPKNVIGEITKVLSSTIYVKWPTFDDTNCYLEDDLELYKEPIMKKEKVKPQTFCITGKPHHLQAMEEDLKEIGYVIKGWDKIGKLVSNLFAVSKEDAYEDFAQITYTYHPSTKNKSFSLPEQYSEALQFCKEQLEIAAEYFKPEEPEFKVGQWLYSDSCNLVLFRYKGDTDKGEVLTTNEYYQVTNSGRIIAEGESDCFITRSKVSIATPEQIERILTIVAKEKGFVEGVNFEGINKATCKLNGIHFTLNGIRYDSESDALCSGGWLYSKGVWAEIVKETFPQIEIAGYKAEFTDKTVNFGCNHIPYTTFVNIYQAFKGLPEGNNVDTIAVTYSSHSFKISFEQIEEINNYYLKKCLP